MNNAATAGNTTYFVDYVIEIDHPEARNNSFSYRPQAGTKVPQTFKTNSRKSALYYFAGLLAGEEDFGSEYVSSVSVWMITKSGRRICLRPKTSRTRNVLRTLGSEIRRAAEYITRTRSICSNLGTGVAEAAEYAVYTRSLCCNLGTAIAGAAELVMFQAAGETGLRPSSLILGETIALQMTI